MSQEPPCSIAIIGGGCSGALTAYHLLRQAVPLEIHLIEPRKAIGRGLAFSTAFPEHLLNVPAGKMSLCPSHPTDFVDWLQTALPGSADPNGFVPRGAFGRYVAERLEAALSGAGPHQSFSHHRTNVLGIEQESGRAVLRLANQDYIRADLVVLAVGNTTPKGLRYLGSSIDGPVVFGSPWRTGALAVAKPGAPVLLVGSGLTAVDAFLGLRANGHRGVVHMVSTRGWLPHRHLRIREDPPELPPTGLPLREFVHQTRAIARRRMEAGLDWRPVVDGLRERTNEIWSSWTVEEQRRFLRHVKGYWDIHRHRMAPQIALRVTAALEAGDLQIHAARVVKAAARDGGAFVTIETCQRQTLFFDVARVINCAGLEHDYKSWGHPLLQAMFRHGWLDSGELGTGLRTTANGAVIDRQGKPSAWLYAIGPMRIGGLFETTAVPEIRAQAAALAKTLAEAAARVHTLPESQTSRETPRKPDADAVTPAPIAWTGTPHSGLSRSTN